MERGNIYLLTSKVRIVNDYGFEDELFSMILGYVSTNSIA